MAVSPRVAGVAGRPTRTVNRAFTSKAMKPKDSWLV
jgi:hypothetical protein